MNRILYYSTSAVTNHDSVLMTWTTSFPSDPSIEYIMAKFAQIGTLEKPRDGAGGEK